MRLLVWFICGALGGCTADVFIGPEPIENETTSGGDSEGSTSKGIDEDGSTSSTSNDPTGKPKTTHDADDEPTTTKSPDDSTTSDTKGSSTGKDSDSGKSQLDCEPDEWDCIEGDGATTGGWEH